jgi:hypothetical protein
MLPERVCDRLPAGGHPGNEKTRPGVEESNWAASIVLSANSLKYSPQTLCGIGQTPRSASHDRHSTHPTERDPVVVRRFSH